MEEKLPLVLSAQCPLYKARLTLLPPHSAGGHCKIRRGALAEHMQILACSDTPQYIARHM
eukprot:3917883-Amphidinium_carterae.1